MASNPRGYVSFDNLTPPEFELLVKQTLEESIWIETEWDDGPLPSDDDVLLVKEVEE